MWLISAIKNILRHTPEQTASDTEMTLAEATEILANMDISFAPMDRKERTATLVVMKSNARPLDVQDLIEARENVKRNTDLFVSGCNRSIYRVDMVSLQYEVISMSLPKELHYAINNLLSSEREALLDHIATISGYSEEN